MRNAFKSALSFAWATLLFGVAQAARLFTSAGRGRQSVPRSFTAIEPAASRHATRPEESDERTSEVPMNQRSLVGRTGRLDPDRIVVLGEGLAAGAGSFGLAEDSQHASFVAQAVRQMGGTLIVPYLQSPGIAGAPGYPLQPVILPALMQTTVVDEFPLRRRHQNIAVPGYEVADCLRRRPVSPLVHRDDARQTIANLVLGLPALTHEPGAERPTQLEYAVAGRPSLAIVVFGYAEALRAALSGSMSHVPEPGQWSRDYGQIVEALHGACAALVLATVPDPCETAVCLPLAAAARDLCVDPNELASAYALDADDCLTVRGVISVGGHLLKGPPLPLDAHQIVRGEVRRGVSEYVARLNAAIVRVAEQTGALVLDLHGIAARVRASGVDAGHRRLTADLFGGFYTLNGAYPGTAGHAVLANELLVLLNTAFGTSFPSIDVGSVAAGDATADAAPGRGHRPVATPQPLAPRRRDTAVRTRRTNRAPGLLRLPASLEMTVPLCHATSYHGDAIRVVNCTAERDMQFGSCPDVLFGGPVLFDSHVSGELHIRFSPPVDNRARFEVRFEPLAGDDGVLSAPMFFRWPVTQCLIVAEPGTVASGTVDLSTGESHDVMFAVRYLNTALQALVSVNPGFPDQPIVFPGQYGSAWALFEQRDEGLDFTFYGSTFLPLGAALAGQTVRWALPFGGAGGPFASIPARGLAMHPHLHLCTRDVDESVFDDVGDDRSAPIELPQNTITEMTLFTRRSSFGDRFTLNSPELGGPATGRSHLLGRLLVQTGEPFGDSLPVFLSLAGPGGVLGATPPSPLSALFPGRLSPGPVGHDEHLRFPTRNYFLDGVTLVDDPFDLSVAAVDLRSGRFINQVLHRAFIGQDLFFSLIRVEPRTPQASFSFRGPAAFDRGQDGTPVFRLRAVVRIPYPTGFLFPAPDFTTAITVGDQSLLDPYLWIRAAVDAPEMGTASKAGREVRSSTGEQFSYRFELNDDGAASARFEYVNHDQGGVFRLETVSWLGRSHGDTRSGAQTDVVTFSGLGRWSKDPTGRSHQVAAQIATGAEEYVSIQIDGGLVSNVNTKPKEELAALP
jgi:hypothetical protein